MNKSAMKYVTIRLRVSVIEQIDAEAGRRGALEAHISRLAATCPIELSFSLPIWSRSRHKDAFLRHLVSRITAESGSGPELASASYAVAEMGDSGLTFEHPDPLQLA
jgi:hypothetical protein